MTFQHIKRWTKPDCYIGTHWPEYYSSGVGQSRDSDCLEQSNFFTMLDRLGGESSTVIVVTASHWAVGWVAWIAIHESDTKSLAIADKERGSLEDYCALDEDDWSRREDEAANETWKNCYNEMERIDYIRKNREQFYFHDWRDLVACVRGQFFNGYASELLS